MIGAVKLVDISTHALTEGDQNNRYIKSSFHISTHALTEGDETIHRIHDIFCISTHALTEGDADRSDRHHRMLYFNSRPHGGRQRCFSSFQHFSSISTHALTEGDEWRSNHSNIHRISTHALTEGDIDYGEDDSG